MENGDEEQREGENERETELERDKEIDAGKGDPLSSFLSPFWFAKVRNSDTHEIFRTTANGSRSQRTNNIVYLSDGSRDHRAL